MSGLSKLERLMYSIGVVDKASAPVNKIMAKINQLSSQASGAQDQMMRGFMGTAGGAMMLVGSLNPAIAANQALGEVRSLDVAESSLQQLNNTSINFSAKYGGNAADVISASYDIQSSIAGLTGQELSAFTNASAIMAKGTKSDASTATNYLGTMYGIYQDNATAVGKTQWVEQLAGQTATAVRMFKTNGNEMSSAFTSLGAGAQSHGIEMSESMAVLGQLQATMSGSEAGTKYKAFLAGVGKAQEQLGIQMTDAHGKLLPMPDVLENLHKKFGLIDTVAKSDALKSAFGSDEATGLIKLLLPQVSQLQNNIENLNKQTGMQTAIDMADAQTDAWMRLTGGFNAAATALGQAVLPIIEPVVEVLGAMLRGVLWLSREFPMLTGILATVVVGVTALIITMGLFNMLMGFSKFALIGFGSVTSIVTTTQALFNKTMQLGTAQLWLRSRASNAATAASLGYNNALLYAGLLMSRIKNAGLIGSLVMMKGAILGAATAAWGFAGAILAAAWPIALIAGGVVLLATLVYKYWQPIKAFMGGVWSGLVSGFAPVTSVFSVLFDSLSFVGDIFSWFGQQIGFTSSELGGFAEAGKVFGSIIAGVFEFLLLPVTAFIKLITGAINVIKDIAGWVSDVFSDDVEIKANKTVEHIADNAAVKVADKNSSLIPSNVVPINIATLAEKRNNGDAEKLNNNSARKIEKTNYFNQLAQNTSNNSNTRTDQSKRVYVDSLTIKSDDAFATSEQLMELAG